MSRSSRPERPPTPRRTAVLALLLCALAAWALSPLSPVSCSEATPAPTDGAPEHVYTVRGRIESLPDGTQLGQGLMIRHEEIPDFVNVKGERTGMRAMIMPFEPAKGLDLSAVKVGDPVEFIWEVRWTTPRYGRVSKMMRLPPETELRLPGP
ncbi:MAG: copper-binding protein [Phycisphaerales bacterium]